MDKNILQNFFSRTDAAPVVVTLNQQPLTGIEYVMMVVVDFGNDGGCICRFQSI